MKTPITKTLMAIALTAMATFFAGCGPDEPDSPNNQTPPTPTTVAVTGVSLNKSSMTLTEGGSETLTASVAPSNATNTGVSWSSSNTGVATVNGGQVTAVKAGTATITVTTSDGGKTATCSVTVEAKKVAVTGVKFDIETLELIEGETGTIKVTVEPADATDQKVNWTSSNPEVVTVADGVVTAVAPGTATIIATSVDGGKTASCNVTINPKPIPVEGVSVEVETVEIVEGETAAIVVTVTPEDASVKDVTFASSDETVATVDEEGNITAVAPGTATITITTADGGKTATCEVTVTPKVVPVEGIAFTKEQVSVVEGEKVLLYVSFTPKNASDKRVTWSSSDTGVATIDTKGNVTGVKPGTATITVKTTDGGKTATCVVNVTKKPTPVSGVKINRSSLTLTIGGSAILVATVSPEDATNQKVVWSSSDESIATVDQNGEVTAVKTGSAKITATTEDGDKTTTCDVTVTDKPVSATGVTLDKRTLSLFLNQTSQLAATVAPANATNHDVTWSSSNTSVATVDKTGKVTAAAIGSATITAKTHNGKTATCTVTVSERYIVYYNNSAAGSSLKYILDADPNNYIRFKVYDKLNGIYLSLGALNNVTVTSNNTSVANATGSSADTKLVTAYKAGSATLTFKHSGRTIKTISLTVANPNLILLCSTSLASLGPSSSVVPSSLRANKGTIYYMRFYDNDNKKMVTSSGYKVKNGYDLVKTTVASSNGEYVKVEYVGSGEAPITISHGSTSYTFTVRIPGKMLISTSATSYKAFIGTDVTMNPGQELKLYFWDENFNMRFIPNEESVTLTSSNTQVATLSYKKSDGYIKYKGVASGIVRLIIKYKDSTGLVTGEWDGTVLIGEGGLGITTTNYSNYARLATGSETPPTMNIKKNGITKFTLYNYDRSVSIPISSRLARHNSYSMKSISGSSHINCSYSYLTINGIYYPEISLSQTGGSVGETRDYEISFIRYGESKPVTYKVRFKIVD